MHKVVIAFCIALMTATLAACGDFYSTDSDGGVTVTPAVDGGTWVPPPPYDAGVTPDGGSTTPDAGVPVPTGTCYDAPFRIGADGQTVLINLFFFQAAGHQSQCWVVGDAPGLTWGQTVLAMDQGSNGWAVYHPAVSNWAYGQVGTIQCRLFQGNGSTDWMLFADTATTFARLPPDALPFLRCTWNADGTLAPQGCIGVMEWNGSRFIGAGNVDMNRYPGCHPGN